jgi:two-component system phosphate regulon response regulator PhoB
VHRTPLDVLLVEADPERGAHLEEALRNCGEPCRVRRIWNGPEALLHLDRAGEREPLPSLILLDLQLPGLSGLEVLSEVRKRPDLRKIPVVVLSPAREGIELTRALEAGAHSSLVIPVPPDELCSLVETVRLYWSPPDRG